VRESRPPGSVRGASSNGRPYRDTFARSVSFDACTLVRFVTVRLGNRWTVAFDPVQHSANGRHLNASKVSGGELTLPAPVPSEFPIGAFFCGEVGSEQVKVD
jgi:hypothetical protein